MINKKTKFCKAAALLGAVVMMISALAGCGKNTKVVLTAGLKKNEVFRTSSASCVLPEVMVYPVSYTHLCRASAISWR